MTLHTLYQEFSTHIARLLSSQKCEDKVAIDQIDLLYERILDLLPDDLSKQAIGAVYNLLDLYCDAVRHDFNEVENNYSLNEARSDIEYIIKVLAKGTIHEVIANSAFLKKISGL